MRRISPGRRLRYATEAFCVQLFRLVFSRLPADRASRIAGRFGQWLPRRFPKFLRRAERNVATGLPDRSEAERSAIAAAHFGGVARTFAEYFHLETLVDDPHRLEVIGGAHVRAACATGKGIIFASAHMGNPEACRVAAGRLGAEPGLVYRPPNNLYLKRLAGFLLERRPGRMFPRGATGMVDIRNHVRAGGSVLILLDQRSIRGTPLPFLGREAMSPLGAMRVAETTGAAVIPVYSTRCPGDRVRFRVTFEPPIAQGTPAEMMTTLNDSFGRWIRADPAGWFWLHDRWDA